jgi:hypothetical protein
VPGARVAVPHGTSLRGLSFRFSVRCADARLQRLIDVLFAGLRDPAAAPVDHRYVLTSTATAEGADTGDADTFDVTRDDELLAQGRCAGDALGFIVWDVNRSAAATSGAHLLFHAGALEADGAGIVLPGTSGSGKSTLTAGLARAGLGYLTDELAAFDLASGHLLPYAKPITLKRGSFAVLPDLHPDRTGGPGAGPWDGAEWQVAMGGDSGRRIGRPCPPSLVIVPRYDPAGPTALTPLSDTEAFLSLALHAVNLLAHGVAGSAALGRMVAQSSCYALTMSDLDEACGLVQGLVTTRAATADLRAERPAELHGANHGH